MENNFSKKVASVIWLLGSMGGLIAGKVFEVTTIVGVYYPREETSYNWGLAMGCIISSLITGALFMSLGEIQDSLDKNYNTLSNLNKSSQE